MQDQNIDRSEIKDSDLRLGQAGGDLIQGDGNQITKVYVDLVGRKQQQWNPRQASILKQVQADVRQRLVDVLNNEVLIPLRMQETLESVNRSPLKSPRTLTTHAQSTTPIDPELPILQVFCRKDIAGKLLILGDPGAGKTTTLLTLADSLIAESLHTPGTTIPIIFELSAWKDDRQLIGDWLVEQLKQLYNLSPQESQKWLADRLLLPLLDGLDELGMERQKQCIAQINAFAHHYPQVVVCCRAEEYRTAGATLGDLRGAVCLLPLTDQQIAGYLQSLKLETLWTAMQSSPEMRQMLEPDAEGKPGILRVPLLLSIAAVAYEGKPFESREALYQAYIDQRLAPETRRAERHQVGKKGRGLWAYAELNQEPDWRQTQRTLGWLARQLQRNNMVELLIEDIQPNWLEKGLQLQCYRLLYGLHYGLLYGPFYGAYIGLSYGSRHSVLYGGAFYGAVMGRFYGPYYGPYRMYEMYELIDEVGSELVSGLIYGLFCGLIYGLIYGLVGGSDPDTIQPVEAFKILEQRDFLFLWLLIGLVFLLGGMLDKPDLLDLSKIYMAWLLIPLGQIMGRCAMDNYPIGNSRTALTRRRIQDLQLQSRPNQDIWDSLQNVLWNTAFLSLYLVLLSMFFLPLSTPQANLIFRQSVNQPGNGWVILNLVLAGLPQFLVPSIFFAVMIAVMIAFTTRAWKACFQHVCLRFVLWQSGVAPWNLAQFLNYCVERRLLQRVGGRYRFLHRELLDHFAPQRRRLI